MNEIEVPFETARTETAEGTPNSQESPPRAWEMIENGRYQPRRIKGSCLGRELG